MGKGCGAMLPEKKRQRSFGRRAFIMGGAKLGLLGVLGARAYWLQITHGSEYQTLSDQNRIKLVLFTPDRGIIRDRFGLPMTRNEQSWQLYLDTSRHRNREKILTLIAEILELDTASFIQSVNRRKPVNHRLLLIEHMSWQQVSAIEVRTPDLPGVFVETGKLRVYPYPKTLSHVLGYVALVAEKDADAELFKRLPEMRIGKNGVEKFFDVSLRGVPGIKQQEVNAVGQIIRENPYRAPIPGADLISSLDLELQHFAHDRLMQERSASVVALHIPTGEVRCMASFPGYDPNEFSRGISHKSWKFLLDDIRVPLMNKAIAGQYPPGSTYKMLTGMAGLKHGIVTPETRFYCPGHFYLGNHRFHCWERRGHGSVNLAQAIERSCDTYFYNVGMRLDIDDIASLGKEFAFGDITGVEVPGEKGGILPTKDWKKRRFNDIWRTGDSVNAAIGQGYVLATPIQLAVFAARMATGLKILPTLVKHPDEQAAPKWEKIMLDEKHLAATRQGMFQVVNIPGGTAYGKKIHDPEFVMAGKTGTSQVKALSKIGKSWQDQHHGLFIAYAPYENPRYAVACVVEHGKGGSASAAPVVRDIMLKLREFELRRASGEAPPTLPPPERIDEEIEKGTAFRG
jgi:penicillin-binding protein 2